MSVVSKLTVIARLLEHILDVIRERVLQKLHDIGYFTTIYRLISIKGYKIGI